MKIATKSFQGNPRRTHAGYRARDMADILSPSERSRLMASIGPKDTKPEMIVRRLVFKLGYRYRLHRKDLPGRPDLVFPGRKAVIFVHGCFWHRHPGCRDASVPKSNVEFWERKFRENVDRDARNIAALEEAGWRVLVIWECETVDIDALRRMVKAFLFV